MGVPTVPQVVVGEGAPFSGARFTNNTQLMQDMAQESVGEVVNALTVQPEAPPEVKPAAVPRITKITGSLEDVQRTFLENHWSDGLPIIPPTEEAVEWMLTGTKRSPDEVIGVYEPGMGVATVEKIAANGVMVGARPEYMPVLIALVEAMVDPAFELSGLSTTAANATPLVIINGPIIKELDLNPTYSFNMGYGTRAGLSIGRFARTMMINFSRVWPGENDMTGMGWPAEAGFLFAENEDAIPEGWEPFNVEQGFAPGTSTVSVYPAMGYISQIGGSSASPEIYLTSIAKTIGTPYGMTSDYTGRARVIIMSPSQIQRFIDANWSKDDVKRYLYEYARYSYADCQLYTSCTRHWDMLRQANWSRPVQDSQMIPIVQEPEDFKILVGTGAVYIAGWGHNSHVVTKEIKE